MVSYGLLLYRGTGEKLQVYLVHPGGPFFRNKDEGAWTIPKGAPMEGESPEDAARREFEEETGGQLDGALLPLGSIRQKGGKEVHAWASLGQVPDQPRSNTFEIEWPPRSGKHVPFPEIDRGEFFDLATARKKINPAQIPFLDGVVELLLSP